MTCRASGEQNRSVVSVGTFQFPIPTGLDSAPPPLSSLQFHELRYSVSVMCLAWVRWCPTPCLCGPVCCTCCCGPASCTSCCSSPPPPRPGPPRSSSLQETIHTYIMIRQIIFRPRSTLNTKNLCIGVKARGWVECPL
jgi:hypothetical protein